MAQEIDNFISPEKMRHHDGIDFGIGDGVSQYMKPYATPWPPLGRDHAAPFGGMTHNACDMLRRGDECEFLQRLAVDFDLGREPVEIIFGALNFIAVDATIDDSYVDATPGMRETKFVDHERIWTKLGMSQPFGV